MSDISLIINNEWNTKQSKLLEVQEATRNQLIARHLSAYQ